MIPGFKLKAIVCPTDFSEEASKAVQFAAGIAGLDPECVLYLLHVVKPVYVPVGDISGASEIIVEKNDREIRNSRERLERLASEFRKDGIQTHVSVKTGDPVISILGFAEEYKADMIVMGNRKHGFKKGILLGSVSERVSANSPVSVLIVR
ncbi:MAG: universal stress protein [Candidatus Thermoplasmatota archaeon]|nr:universal stress protein [Candidatus Thermoplasmatota archaeon]MCL5731481.1 universal stress protein [Candidatus Thermoplasmatota archaeon]